MDRTLPYLLGSSIVFLTHLTRNVTQGGGNPSVGQDKSTVQRHDAILNTLQKSLGSNMRRSRRVRALLRNYPSGQKILLDSLSHVQKTRPSYLKSFSNDDARNIFFADIFRANLTDSNGKLVKKICIGLGVSTSGRKEDQINRIKACLENHNKCFQDEEDKSHNKTKKHIPKKASKCTNLRECLHWALNPFMNGQTFKSSEIERRGGKTIKQIRDIAKDEEKAWGNKMIGQSGNGNWTTKLGEGLVYDVLKLLNKKPRKPDTRGHYQPDLETDDAIWEVKSSNWTITGTAGEKVLGTMYKYSDVPKLYGKPLKIVCVAYQEWELSHNNTRIFGDISDSKQKFLDLASDLQIEYVRFSDLFDEYKNALRG